MAKALSCGLHSRLTICWQRLYPPFILLTGQFRMMWSMSPCRVVTLQVFYDNLFVEFCCCSSLPCADSILFCLLSWTQGVFLLGIEEVSSSTKESFHHLNLRFLNSLKLYINNIYIIYSMFNFRNISSQFIFLLQLWDPLYFFEEDNPLNKIHKTQAHTIKSIFVTLLYFVSYLLQNSIAGLIIEAEK